MSDHDDLIARAEATIGKGDGTYNLVLLRDLLAALKKCRERADRAERGIEKLNGFLEAKNAELLLCDNDTELLHEALEVVGGSPITSKYHGKGFDYSRFMDDYWAWQDRARALAAKIREAIGE